MTPAYAKGLKIGQFCRKEDPEAVPTNPYPYASIDAMEWDRGFNHGLNTPTDEQDKPEAKGKR